MSGAVNVLQRRKRLRPTLNIPFHELHDTRGLAEDMTNLGRWGHGDVVVSLSDPEELSYVLGLFRQAFEADGQWRG